MNGVMYSQTRSENKSSRRGVENVIQGDRVIAESCELGKGMEGSLTMRNKSGSFSPFWRGRL